MTEEQMETATDQPVGLLELVRGFEPDCDAIIGLRRLSGGASQETWSFDARCGTRSVPLILRRSGGGKARTRLAAISLSQEAGLIRLAAEAGVPVPRVHAVIPPDHPSREGFIMSRVDGETIPRKTLRDERFARARPLLARQCGEILARMHAIDASSLPALRRGTAADELAIYLEQHRSYRQPRPVLELTFRWLKDHMPPDDGALTLVHGDFRHGNLMIDENGVVSVLDWELAYVGDPMADLGWLCVNSWRYGHRLPVGGFGTREQLFEGYEAAGGRRVDPQRVRFWETLGTLRWSVMCESMLQAFRDGFDRSVERLAIGRRSSEAEIDLLRLLSGRD